MGRAGSNLLGLWPLHFCGNSWAESKTEVGWASPDLGPPQGRGPQTVSEKACWGNLAHSSWVLCGPALYLLPFPTPTSSWSCSRPPPLGSHLDYSRPPPPLSVSILKMCLHVAAQPPFLTATRFPKLEDMESAVFITNW